MLRAVLFDLDGTLLDTLDDLADSVNMALAELGLPGHDRERFRTMVGNGIRKLAVRALPPEFTDEAGLAAVAASIARMYSANAVVKTRPYPGIPGLLRALATRNVPMAVLTNKPHDLAVRVVATLLPDTAFATVQGETRRFPPKPDPASALDLCSRFGWRPAEVLFVGDSDVDMLTAANAGMVSAGVTWGFRGREELESAGANHLFDHPEGIARLFG